MTGGDGGEVVVVAADDDCEGFQQFVRSRDGAGCRFRRHGSVILRSVRVARRPERCPPRTRINLTCSTFGSYMNRTA
ncbi:hypothetical protein GCM10010518_43390 [Kitasatospora cinereorecta]